MTIDTATHPLPRPESIDRAVDGSWYDALIEAIAFARRLTNREV
jgi:hypothetical protein